MDFSTTRNRFGDIKISDHLMAVNQLSATGVVIGAVAIFLVDINHQAPVRMPCMVSRQANIFVCTLWSRPGLFVPTLFVMHDVSLTPTKKVA
ncbi:hypothetical protein K492DRAFT_170587 [Lichtheimia hyalospora FSU 10163]|nr:hypothetical protein K492DRAFT_170587 [Lichtheimia hyalospora FSU 10163]